MEAELIKNTCTYFEIKHGNGVIGSSKWSDYKYSFPTQEEAVREATEFKSNPRRHNENMSDSNVAYWQSQTFIIVKKTIHTEELQII